jgi:UDP:flavonoid glycosyltransferase YjiC (YdhE family)
VNILLLPLGSAGDVHPFVGLGLALQARGHNVLLATNGHFAPLAGRVGLAFSELGAADEFEDVLNNPDLWHPTKGFRLVTQGMQRLLRPVYELISDRYVPGETVVVAGALALGARIAQEKFGVPVATVHLQPAVFRSVYEGPVLGERLSMARPGPHWLKRFGYWAMDALVIDRLLGPAINAFRIELGMQPVRRLFDVWWNSPQCILGLFPDWYAPPQPDWPPQTRLVGFPLFDERGVAEIPAGLEQFLDAGDPPIVFTPGSAMRHGRAFFDASVAACLQLGRRGVLLTRFRDQLPESLPDSVRHFEYVPFSQVLPRSAALVYHGGIGTCSQALAAGVPHLVVPFAHDQPDNAARLERLGVGRTLWPRHYQAPAVARVLNDLLSSAATSRRCAELAARCRETDTLSAACSEIERLAASAASTSASVA